MTTPVKLEPSEIKLLLRLRDLLRCNKQGHSQIVTIRKIGGSYQLGSITNQGIIKKK